MVVWAVRLEENVDGQIIAGTRIEKVMASVRQRIASRSLVPGARLPSVRALAKAMQVSTSTIVEAYDRLVADGTISS
ncbi:GntR family transcriptional regulator, partial [Escherichia coli]|uniref:GntR family transcriptional regulator n=1 Tax=Escherichia coli TaxID=562 RepID=UPI0028EFA917